MSSIPLSQPGGRAEESLWAVFKRWARAISMDFISTIMGLNTALMVGLIFIWRQDVMPVAPTVVWAFACVAGGWVVGFLFGIPRVLQQDMVRPARPGEPVSGAAAASAGGATKSAPQGGGEAAIPYRQQVNTNLEQISDWLTKIIVGVGLIELRRLPEALRRLSGFMARGSTNYDQAQVLCVSVVVYFGILGFIGGYLVTRIYLAGAFERADTSRGQVQVGNESLSIEQAVDQQRILTHQLLEQVARIERRAGAEQAPDSPRGAGAQLAEPPPAPGRVKSVLWIDDNPTNVSYLVDYLKKHGVEVVTLASTADALKALAARAFDVVITDLGRTEDGDFNPTAGVDLIEKVRAAGANVRVVVYTSGRGAFTYGEKAFAAGASAVTDSPSSLLNALGLG